MAETRQVFWSEHVRAIDAINERLDRLAVDREPYRTTTYTQRLDALERRVEALEPADTANPLPAPALTEDAIVAAMKDDPAMAGRVIAGLAVRWTPVDRRDAASAAGVAVSAPPNASGYSLALQSLAVALAAASYRG